MQFYYDLLKALYYIISLHITTNVTYLLLHIVYLKMFFFISVSFKDDVGF